MSWFPEKNRKKQAQDLSNFLLIAGFPIIDDVLNFHYPVNFFQVAHGFYCNF